MEKPEFTSISKLTLAEFYEKFEPIVREVSKRKRFWIHLIETNQLTCPVTGKTVAYCSYDHKESTNTFHYNFYSSDGEMFSIDHKKPKSLGGSNRYSNIQPMIHKHNLSKANQLIYT